MGRNVPEDWTTIRVAELGIKGSYPHNLFLIRKSSKATTKIYVKYLPDKEDDHRPHKGRINNGKGKRAPIEISMKTEDLYEAAQRAIQWWKQKNQSAFRESKTTQKQYDSSLHRYWNAYFSKQ